MTAPTPGAVSAAQDVDANEHGRTKAAALYRQLARRVAASLLTDRNRGADLIDALAQAATRTTEPAQHRRGA